MLWNHQMTSLAQVLSALFALALPVCGLELRHGFYRCRLRS